MSRYNNWLIKQGKSFINEIAPNETNKERFIDYNLKPITLDELKLLDNKYCNEVNTDD